MEREKETLNNDYRVACDFLYSFVNYERTQHWKYSTRYFNLKQVIKFFGDLGNPHEHGWFVHIAGTNGKGSVAAMIANILTLAGFRTGLYTSPHLMSFRERIRVNGYMITPDDVVSGVARIKPVTEHFQGLTFFDVWTALAFDHFAHISVNTAVIEVGMGGRLDTTNVITPAVSVITSIGFDHCGKLGKSLIEIAEEKAGIMKHGIPVVTAPQMPDVLRVLERRARQVGTKIFIIGRDITFNQENNALTYRGLNWNLHEIFVPLNGSLQLQNAAVALAALEILVSEGYSIDPTTARRGIETVQWPGRLQTISAHPEIIVDGACNTGAMHKVVEFLLTRKTRENIVAVVALCKDKEVKQVLDILGNAASRIVFTQVNNPRVMNARELAERAPEGVQVIVENDPVTAMEKARTITGTDDLIIVTGSLYLVGEVLRIYGKVSLEKI